MAEEKAKQAYRRAVKGLIKEIAAVTAVLFITFTFFFGICMQRGNGMYPAIKDGDLILYCRVSKILNTEAVVYEKDGKLHAGRVAASGGAVISVTGDMQMTFDGNYLPISRGDGIYDKTYASDDSNLPLTLSEDAFYILGDNRREAEDSRAFGPVGKKLIKGRIIAVLRRRQI